MPHVGTGTWLSMYMCSFDGVLLVTFIWQLFVYVRSVLYRERRPTGSRRRKVKALNQTNLTMVHFINESDKHYHKNTTNRLTKHCISVIKRQLSDECLQVWTNDAGSWETTGDYRAADWLMSCWYDVIRKTPRLRLAAVIVLQHAIFNMCTDFWCHQRIAYVFYFLLPQHFLQQWIFPSQMGRKSYKLDPKWS